MTDALLASTGLLAFGYVAAAGVGKLVNWEASVDWFSLHSGRVPASVALVAVCSAEVALVPVALWNRVAASWAGVVLMMALSTYLFTLWRNGSSCACYGQLADVRWPAFVRNASLLAAFVTSAMSASPTPGGRDAVALLLFGLLVGLWRPIAALVRPVRRIPGAERLAWTS